MQATQGKPPQRIQRVDRPDRELLCLTVYQAAERTAASETGASDGQGRTRVLMLSFGAIVGAGYVPRRPRGAPADSLTQRLRRALVGARIMKVEMNEACVTVTLALGDTAARLIASPKGLRLETEDDSFGVGPPVDTELLTGLTEVTGESLDALGPVLSDSRSAVRLEHTRRFVRTRLTRALKRLTRKRRKISADVERGARAAELRHDADLLLAHPHVQATPTSSGESTVEITDWALDPPAPREISLPAGADPQAHARRCYERARRWERGARLVQPRLDTLDETLASLQAWRSESMTTADEARLRAIADQAAQLGVREFRQVETGDASSGKPAKRRPRLPYRIYESHGQVIWVGRGARDNDTLTLRHARPHHVWLHVRGTPGAHVVVPVTRKQKPTSEVLLDAATLAAHFSDARGELIVEVDHTTRGQVSKPKGSAAGSVNVRTAKTLRLRFEPARLARLLASERTV